MRSIRFSTRRLLLTVRVQVWCTVSQYSCDCSIVQEREIACHTSYSLDISNDRFLINVKTEVDLKVSEATEDLRFCLILVVQPIADVYIRTKLNPFVLHIGSQSLGYLELQSATSSAPHLLCKLSSSRHLKFSSLLCKHATVCSITIHKHEVR
jgi:hypothetical protein